MIIQSKKHSRLRLDQKVHPKEIVLAQVRPGLFEGEVPDHVGDHLLSAATTEDDFKQVMEPTPPEDEAAEELSPAAKALERRLRQTESDHRARARLLEQRERNLDEDRQELNAREKDLDTREASVKAREIAAVTPAEPAEPGDNPTPAQPEGLEVESASGEQAQSQQDEASEKGGRKGRR